MYSLTKAIIFAITLLPAITFAKENSETCLAKTIYYECRGCKNPNEKLDIAKLVVNRTKHKKFPKTVCGVVYQHKQFKWTNKNSKIKEHSAWEESQQISREILTNPNISKLKDNVIFFKLKSSNIKLANNIKLVKFNDKRMHNFYEEKS